MSSVGHVNVNLKLRALSKEGRLKEALHILLTAHNPPVPVDSSTYLSLLQACAANKALSEGEQIHSHINSNDRVFTFATNTILQNTVLNMYEKCGNLVAASKVFNGMIERDVSSWNMMISAYRRRGLPQQAFELFQRMQGTGVPPNQFTFSIVLPLCADVVSRKYGLQIHGKIIRCRLLSNVIVMNALIDAYAKCGDLHNARQVFDKMPQRNVVSWTAMLSGYAQNGIFDEALRLFEGMPHRNVVSWTAVIAGYAQNGLDEKALEIYKEMQLAGAKPDSATFASILPVCAKIRDVEHGMEIHKKIIESRFSSNVVVANALVDMYSKCGSIQRARDLFDEMPQRNTVSWTAMITGYMQHGMLDEALRLFKEMPQQDVVSWTALISGYAQDGLVETALEFFKQMQLAGVKPDLSLFASVLSACAKLGTLKQGMEIHQKIIASGFLSGVAVNALIDMYAKCGSIRKAHQLFDNMPKLDVVSWTAIITGYVQNGLFEKALETFKEMHLACVKPNSITFASILPACAKMGALEQGVDFHQKLIKSGFTSDIVVAGALIDMYAKCGSIQKARNLFDKMPERNVYSWNAMIAGYGMHGYIKAALSLFELMKLSETNPDQVSFACVFFACSHAGLVDDGCKYFNFMSESYLIMPTMDHYICMVDLLGRAGYIEEALNFVTKMPIEPDVVVWICLLGACRSHKNTRLGEFVATILFELDPKNPAPYVLLSNIYAEVGRWGDFQKVRKLMKGRGDRKIPGCSWIEVRNIVHAFSVGDGSHLQTQDICGKL